MDGGKLAAETAAPQVRRNVVPVSVVRPPIVLGDGDKKGLAMFKCIAQTGLHFVPGRFPHRFSVIHSRDLVNALMLAAQCGARIGRHREQDKESEGQGFYFVADDEQPTFADLGRLIGEALGRKRVRVVRIPMPAMWVRVAASNS